MLSFPLWKPNSMEIKRMIFHCSRGKKRTHLDFSSFCMKLYIMYRKRVSSLSRKNLCQPRIFTSAVFGCSLCAARTVISLYVLKLEAHFSLERPKEICENHINGYVAGTGVEHVGWIQLVHEGIQCRFVVCTVMKHKSRTNMKFLCQLTNCQLSKRVLV